MRKRRKRHEEHENNDRWLITYSDLITLLLVFFIVLYSMSEVQNDKFNALVQSLRTTFSGDAVMNTSDNPPTSITEDIPKAAKDQSKADDGEDEKSDKDQLDKLYVKLQDYINKNHLDSSIELENIPRGVQITFKEKILFDLGKADIKKQAETILQSMGGILNSVSNPIAVEGHTDNNPIINSSEFHSNWELASKRAENVMLFLINNDDIKSSRMRFTSYGQYQPVEKNDTAEHQAMNRRVNIVILRETSASQ
ncbi:chemotaxis protein MotB [Pullulanibacillus pueri]|uniref:Chemotaxis protein MotB n=1 Tax=Pullulanibacillus pueri TaxID=1437324 RepID=A0A8J2ZSX9_9BACL|nr:flagellar motor protein MotB [Pullulanibacillus pueri]MBM7681878.1 chemotaxis protein MotB [Pullulanibacillus pueri]GGH76444.1 chemotaxis protein MotB [Pullulanibacillus pueri]